MRPSFSIYRVFALVAGLLFSAAPSLAQQVTTYTLDPASEVSIDGTSTRSDWTVYADDIEGNFGLSGTGDALQVHQGQFAVRAKEVVSRRSTIMDRLIDDALKVEEHPVIRFDLASATAGSSAGTFDVAGKLSLGGVTKDVNLAVKAEPVEGGKVRFTGSHALKMSDYGLEAPVAMFGALRTGDEVTVNFNLVVAPAQ